MKTFGTVGIQWTAYLGQQENLSQGALKDEVFNLGSDYLTVRPAGGTGIVVLV